MKKIIYIVSVFCLLFMSSCENWLTNEDQNTIGTSQAYSSVAGISSVAANLYSRLRYAQDFGLDASGGDLNDMCRWDEASNNSAYWDWADNVGQGYREYYDYTLVREINIHISALKNNASTEVDETYKKYFLAEARYMRAFVYFTLVWRMGGVPILEEAQEYTENPITLAKPRNKETEVYDFITNELDAILPDLEAVNPTLGVKTRATKGAALALKCRAMLYAGTLAYNFDKSSTKGLNLPSGATGIPKDKANEYLQKCIDAYLELEDLGQYSLYQKKANLSENYNELFQREAANPEIIFCKDYNGVTFKNDFTRLSICRAMNKSLKAGCIVNPVFNIVNDYEQLSTRTKVNINPYVGAEQLETMGDGISNLSYKIYSNPSDIFADRDPRLSGTVLYPGSSFRGSALDFQAGLAIKTGSGYEFRTIPTIEGLNGAENMYNGQEITKIEGPHRSSSYVSHTGFLMRKFVDEGAGTEAEGASKVPYIIFRYGEVLLNAAEAAFYLSQNGVNTYSGKNTATIALDCINKIRERAGGADFKITTAELNFERIMNERRVELAYEDHRYNDLKRWRIADDVWAYDSNNPTSVMYGLWPYKIYAPGDDSNGKWIYRKVKLEHRGNTTQLGRPLNFDRKMYYASYPMNEGNPYIEKNPNH